MFWAIFPEKDVSNAQRWITPWAAGGREAAQSPSSCERTTISTPRRARSGHTRKAGEGRVPNMKRFCSTQTSCRVAYDANGAAMMAYVVLVL